MGDVQRERVKERKKRRGREMDEKKNRETQVRSPGRMRMKKIHSDSRHFPASYVFYSNAYLSLNISHP